MTLSAQERTDNIFSLTPSLQHFLPKLIVLKFNPTTGTSKLGTKLMRKWDTSE
jgi:hypothetical protein